jgi:hypothetical protein
MPQFKTRYVPDQIPVDTTGDSIRGAGQALGQMFEGMATAKNEKKKEYEVKHGFDKSLENVPSGKGRYAIGLQKAYDAFSNAALKAKNSNDEGPLLAEANRLRQQYEEISAMSSGVSKLNTENYNSFNSTNGQGVSGGMDKINQQYQQYNESLPYTTDEYGTLMIEGQPWDPNNGPGSMTDIFTVEKELKEIKYAHKTMSTEVTQNILSNKNLVMIPIKGTNWYSGRDTEKMNKMTGEHLNLVLASTPEYASTISLEMYALENSMKDPSELDYGRAEILYNPAAERLTVNTDNGEFFASEVLGYNEDGTVNFRFSDEEITNLVSNADDRAAVLRWRKAKKSHFETVRNEVDQQVSVEDETHKKVEKDRSDAEAEAKSNNSGKQPKLAAMRLGQDGSVIYTPTINMQRKISMNFSSGNDPLQEKEGYITDVEFNNGAVQSIVVGFMKMGIFHEKVTVTPGHPEFERVLGQTTNEMIQDGYWDTSKQRSILYRQGLLTEQQLLDPTPSTSNNSGVGASYNN